MADAARSARGSFSDIKSGAREMGAEVGGTMGSARHGVMMLGEEFGIHLPRGLTTFIASLGPVGAAMSAAFPFIAIAVGATLLLEHLEKMRQAGEKLTEDQSKFALAAQSAFNALDEKLLQAGIRADELNKNHFGALKKQLELIDRQSMGELEKTFDMLALKTDKVFTELKSHWYTFGIGSAGAQHALTEFQSQYDMLLEKGKNKEASDLLAGTRRSAEHVLAMMKQANTGQAQPGEKSTPGREQAEAILELRKAGVGQSEKEIEAQHILVDALNTQVGLEGKIAQLKAAQASNAAAATQKTIGAEADKVLRANAAEEAKELAFAEKQREEAYKRALSALQESEREKIEATEHGSAGRLAAIVAAIQEENNWGLQDTGYYRSLLTARVEVTRQMTDEQNKLTAEAGKEQAEHTLKMGELTITAERQSLALRISMRRMSLAQILAEELKISREDYEAKMTAFAQEIAALDKHGKDYENKLKALQDKETELTRKHEDEIVQLQQSAAAKSAQILTQAYNRMGEAAASAAAKSIMSGQNMAQSMEKVAGAMLQTALKNLLMLETVQGRKRFGDARTAAADAFESAGNPVLGAIEAAVAFTAVMAFAAGTDRVPGVGRGDIVPAMLTPGEGVVPGGVMDGLSRVARSGGFDGGGTHYHATTHVHLHASALDSDGIDQVFTKHAGKIQRHFENTLRKMNRG
jgi:hypothetical protein